VAAPGTCELSSLCQGIEFDGVDNKDASVFLLPFPIRLGYRPWPFCTDHSFLGLVRRKLRVTQRPGRLIFIARAFGFYCSTKMDDCEPHHLCHFGSHHRLATPVEPWERLENWGRHSPALTRHGWLVVYHGVGETAEPTKEGRKLCYSAGVMVLEGASARDLLSFAASNPHTGHTARAPRDSG
jgi:hypothetical protein